MSIRYQEVVFSAISENNSLNNAIYNIDVCVTITYKYVQ